MANYYFPIWSIILAIFFTNSVSTVNARCHISENHLRHDWRIIIKMENDIPKLLREQNVEDNTVLHLVCNNNDITEVRCENGHFNPPLQTPSCSDPLQPQLNTDVGDKNLCPYQLYRLGFQINFKNQNYFFETYRVCFDHKLMRSVFTINEAYPFVIPRPFGMQFDPDHIFARQIFSAYNKRDIYAQFQKLLGANQRFMPDNANDERFDRGHLTPVADFMSISLIRTTFKMINVIPQFHTINSGNWNVMEEWARNPINTPAKVCSGALPWVLELPDSNGNLRQMYLRDNLIPIPLWTYKIVLNKNNQRTVFLQYNNIHDRNGAPQIPQQICNTVSCPYKNINLRKSNYYGYTYCCEATHFLRSTVPNLQGHC